MNGGHYKALRLPCKCYVTPNTLARALLHRVIA